MIKPRSVRWAGYVERMSEMINECNISVGKCEGNRPLKRPIHKRADNIKRKSKEIRYEGVD
jgi:hypothetical protein